MKVNSTPEPKMNPDPTTQATVAVRATASRRQFRLSISSDMEDIWRRLKDVRPRAATRELEWLLRLGILTERAGGPALAAFMASGAEPQPGRGRAFMFAGCQPQPKLAESMPQPRSGDTQLDLSPAAGDSEDSG